MTEVPADKEPKAAAPSGGPTGGGKPGSGKPGPSWVDVMALILAVLTLGVIVAVLIENFSGGG